jgi:uncharacterized protein
MTLPYIYIQHTKSKGRGVFTAEPIAINTTIEISPVIVMPLQHKVHLDKTLLHDYIFLWGPNETQCCMALGTIPIYNHSYQSNCEYIMDYEADNIIIKTIQAIKAGEELTINYNGDSKDHTPIWFKTK